ncbi:hypothetical protein P5673_030172, partial [Acropora cervicornis]
RATPTGLISIQAPTVATSQGPGASNHDSEQATPTQEAPAESAFQPKYLHQRSVIIPQNCLQKAKTREEVCRKVEGNLFLGHLFRGSSSKTQDVPYGTKEDLLVSISLPASSRNKSSTSDSWDGSLTPQDIFTLAKLTHDSSTKKSVYETLSTDHAVQNSITSPA